jgi:hypothetical protein
VLLAVPKSSFDRSPAASIGRQAGLTPSAGHSATSQNVIPESRPPSATSVPNWESPCRFIRGKSSESQEKRKRDEEETSRWATLLANENLGWVRQMGEDTPLSCGTSNSYFSIGSNNKTTVSAFSVLVPKEFQNSVKETTSAGRSEPDENNSVVLSRSETPRVWKIQVLRNQTPLVSLRCTPYFVVGMANEILLLDGINVMTETG